MPRVFIVSILINEPTPSIFLALFHSQFSWAMCKNTFPFPSHWALSAVRVIPVIAQPCAELGIFNAALQVGIPLLVAWFDATGPFVLSPTPSAAWSPGAWAASAA